MVIVRNRSADHADRNMPTDCMGRLYKDAWDREKGESIIRNHKLKVPGNEIIEINKTGV